MARSTRRDRRNRRGRKQQRSGALLGVAAALVGALLVYQVFLRDDGGSSSPAASSSSAAAAGSGTTTTTAPLEPTLPNGGFDELSLRDPFEPIGQVPSGGGSTVVTTTTTTSAGTIPTTPTTSPAQNPGAVTEVTMVDIYIDPTTGAQTARIRVGASEYTVTEGQQFAGNYQLVRFKSDTCAELTYASSGFTLCTGQQTLK
jgi:hypothetical protein